jgi:hypothetical protein
MYLNEIENENVDPIHPAQNRDTVTVISEHGNKSSESIGSGGFID